jgi:hypothetical protein
MSSPSLWRTALGFAIAVLGSCALPYARGASPPALPVVLKAEPAPTWDAKFAGDTGWIGGDGVYSAVVDERRIVWLFGDTLLGEVKHGRREGAAIVNNTVAVQIGHNPDSEIRFSSGKKKDSKPAAVFTPADGKGWFWPQAAIRISGRLYIFLPQIDKTKEGGVFGFRQIGQWLAVVDNPTEEPTSWSVKQKKLLFALFEKEHTQSWGSALVRVGDEVYVYGFVEHGKKIGSRSLIVARVAADKFEDFAAWRFRTADSWSDKPSEAVALASGLATEFSVSPMPSRKGFVTVYTENGLSDRTVARFADAPEGPWSEPLLLYKCPEMAKDKGVFCYAAKAHPWAAGKDELLISYCANTWDFGRLFRDAKVYRPKFVRVSLKPSK